MNSNPSNPSFLEEHPTGVGTVIASAVVLLIDKFSDAVNFAADESVLIVAGIAAVLSLFSPRFREN